MQLDDVLSLDTETTGWDLTQPGIRAIQIAALRLVPPEAVRNSFSAYLRQPDAVLDSMTPDAIAITRIEPEEIKHKGNEPGEVLEGLLEYAEGCQVVAAHNWKFDREILHREFAALGIDSPFSSMPFIDTLRLVREAYDEGWDGWGGSKLPDMKLGTCFRGIIPKESWRLPYGTGPHEALYDASMVLKLVEHFHTNIGLSIEDMVAISSEPFVPRVCPIGKDRGQKGLPWSEVDDGFLQWIASNAIWKDDVGMELAVLTEMSNRGMIDGGMVL